MLISLQFGRVEDVVNDCCGYCPVPVTEEEKEVAEEEQKVFVSGRISFMKDDPGRQVSSSLHIQLPTIQTAEANARDSKSARSTP
jgi:hypothetical protein